MATRGVQGWWRVGAAIVLLAAVLAGGPTPQLAGAESGLESPPVRVIITADDTLSMTTLDSVVGDRVSRRLPLIGGVAATLAQSTAATLDAWPGIRVSPDVPVSMEQVSPTTREATTAFVGATGANELTAAGIDGRGVTVAVVDTGITPLRDFGNRLVGGVDLSGENDPFRDGYGHGTFVAGLVAGDGASSGGTYKGEAPGAKVVSIKVAGASGQTSEVYYQPIYTMDRAVAGAEALVRWRHPTRGLLGPGEFIGVAEETGIILRLGSRVLDAACEQAREWSESAHQPLSVSVNLSARQFSQPDLTAQIVDVLWRTGLDPSLLCLEITESVAMQDLDRTITVLHELKGLGVRLALDDFGTGHSSLNYLKRFPVDIVKLDRGFVAGLETSPVDAAIIGAVVSLAGALGITIVAEGVETVGQLERLRALGCPLLQGYLMAQPMPGQEFQRLLRDWAEVDLEVAHLQRELAAS